MTPTLVVMAAGMGSRYGGLKQIDPVGPNGEIVIDYSIYDAIKAGFGKIVFIIRKDIEMAFREKVGKQFQGRNKVETVFVFQELSDLPEGYSVPDGREKPWGTGQAILACKDVVKEPFGVINADDFYGYSSFKLLADYLLQAEDGKDHYDYCLIGYTLRNTLSDHGHVARGVCEVTGDGLLSTINERLKIQKFGNDVRYEKDGSWHAVSPESIVSMNMFGFTPSIIDELENRFIGFLDKKGGEMKSEFLLPIVVGELLKEHNATVKVLHSLEQWFGVTYKEDKPVVQQAIKDMVNSGKYPEKLFI